jgi:hypothetical protein
VLLYDARICARKLERQIERWARHVVEMLMLASWTSIGIMWYELATRIGGGKRWNGSSNNHIGV